MNTIESFGDFVFDDDIESKIQSMDLNQEDAGGNTLLNVACHYNDYTLIKLLLEKGADVNLEDGHHHTPLEEILFSPNHENDEKIIDSLELLLKNGAYLDPNIIIRIYDKLNSQSIIPTIQLCLKYKLDINFEDDDGDTLLIVASTKNNYLDIIQFLLDNGASINYQNSDGKTALMFASENNCVESLKILIKNKANLKLTDYSDNSVISYADKIETLKILLEQGADPNKLNTRTWKELYLYQEDIINEQNQRIEDMLAFKSCGISKIFERIIASYL